MALVIVGRPGKVAAMEVFYSPAYIDTSVEFDTTRKAAAVAAVLENEPVPGVVLVAPEPATFDELVAVHDGVYLDALVSGEPAELAQSNAIGWDDRLFDAVRAAAGGVRDAALAAMRDGRSGSLSSGLHHAKAAAGDGYCVLNGLVIAARVAVDIGGARRILILDLDAHCGGGTAELIDEFDEVEQVDVSVFPFDVYDWRPDARLTICSGEDYLPVVERELARIPEPGSIDLVIYNAGMDVHEHAGGVRGIDTATIRERDGMVYRWADTNGLPVAFALAGGYVSSKLDLNGVARLHRITIDAAARGS